jgi:asparagine synthase (glutamine-hydrolysing)
MCGLGLVLEREASHSEGVRVRVDAISQQQRHRGPDGQGVWLAPATRDNGGGPASVIGLCHQRLSILDLSSAGNQPFESPCGRYLLVYNGEIYNYREIGSELRSAGIATDILAKSSGDTAVLMAAIVAWGPAKALATLNGMWAFAMWDRETRRLVLSRDRLGIKPLYLRLTPERLIVASEVKGVLAASGERFAPNARAVARYLMLGLAGQERDTFFTGVNSFTPASFAEIDLSKGWPGAIEEQRYWRHPLERGVPVRQVSAEELRNTFLDAVRVHLRADVPLGVMLSGGLDSTAIAAAARMVEPEARITTLSVTSSDADSNEEPFIDVAVKALGVSSLKYQVDLDPLAMPAAVERLCWHADAPLKSLASVGLANVCTRAREAGMVVLLSGQGADEQLAGYDKFLYFHLLQRLRQHDYVGAAGEALRFALNGSVFPSFSLAQAKRYMPSLLRQSARRTLGADAAASAWEMPATGWKFREREFDDLTRFSVPTLLEDEDRMSMAASTEMRVPFLDVNVVELLGVTPAEQKLSKGWTKAIFRDAMEPFIPEQICRRRDKRGFTVPHRKLMAGPLKAVIDETFAGEMLSAKAGLVDQADIRSAFDEYARGSKRVSDREIFRYWALEVWARKFEAYLT